MGVYVYMWPKYVCVYTNKYTYNTCTTHTIQVLYKYKQVCMMMQVCMYVCMCIQTSIHIPRWPIQHNTTQHNNDSTIQVLHKQVCM